MKDNTLKLKTDKIKQTGKIKKSIYSFNSAKSNKQNEDTINPNSQLASLNNYENLNGSDTSGLPSVDYKFTLNLGSSLSGELNLSQRALIAGSINGEITSDSLVSIASSAKVSANIKAKTIYIAGEVEGELKAEEKIVLVAPAKVYGSIEAASISISEGVIFEGDCRMSFASSNSDKTAD
jgi:cytoskeletal protein CcmA (bactofilin family)